MAITKTFDRPVAVTTAEESTVLTATYTQEADHGVLDVSFVDGGAVITAAKQLGRFKFTPEVQGTRLRWKVEKLRFSGADDATSSTVPADSNAVGQVQVFYTEWQDLDAAHTQAGDPRS